MTGGNGPLGRRDNGFYTAHYAAVADVDPRIGEHLLDMLAIVGIAAYLKPTSYEHPVTRTAILPSPPTDRLYVDRDAVTTARQLLAEATSGANDATDAIGVVAETGGATESASPALARPAGEHDEFEAAWASIVADFDRSGIADRDHPWPAGEDLRYPPKDPAHEPWHGGDESQHGASLLDGLDTFGADLPDEEEEEDFRPPAPPPLPHVAAVTVIGVLGVIAGLIAIVNPELISILPNTEAQVLGGVSLVVGAIVLIGRLRPGPDDDEPEDPDHGAVI